MKWQILDLITPHLQISELSELTIKQLVSLGIKAVLLDLDRTLVLYGQTEIPAKTLAWVTEAQRANIGLCLISNARSARLDIMARRLGIPGVASAAKPFPVGCRKAIATLGVAPSETALVGDQIFADILAGRLAGVFTVLVSPMGNEEPWFTRVKRPMEKLWLRYLNGK
jgi:uncharacterized protein